MGFLMGFCVDDESYDYETLLDLIFSQLPAQIPDTLPNYLWAVSRGNFVRGVRALIWDRPQDAELYFSKASKFSFKVDEAFVQQVTHELLGYQMVYGIDATQAMLSKISSSLIKFLGKTGVNWLKSGYLVNVSSENYRDGQWEKVPGNVLGVIASRPKYLLDRGIMSILVKSLFGLNPRRSA
jgi:hypothetical protein